MEKYKALKKFSTGPEEMQVTYEVGAIFELNPDMVDVRQLLADGVIEKAPLVDEAFLAAHPDSGLAIGDVIPAEGADLGTGTGEAKIGDACQTADGKQGTLQEVDGAAVCVETPAPVLVEYVVVKGPVSNEKAEVFQTGNAMQFPEGDVFAEQMVEAGFIMLKSEHEKLPKAEGSNAGAPTTPSVAGSGSTKLYRGKAILNEYDRTVNGHTHKHIRTEEGHEYDLTPDEYSSEVTSA